MPFNPTLYNADICQVQPHPNKTGTPPGHLRIMCPNLTCKRILAVPSTSRGKNVRCKSCGAIIRVPQAAAPAPPKPAQNASGSNAAAA